MVRKKFADGDVLFLLETVEPALLNNVEMIKNDPAIIEGMMEHESSKLFQRLMLMSQDTLTTTISPRFLFEVLLRAARTGLQNQAYTVERTASQRIPVFDASEVVQFFDDKMVLNYLADMLTSFTRVESFTWPIRVRKGVWRKIRFNDMDVDSLLRSAQSVDEEYRFHFYKRIADLCLFILGMFPEYVAIDYRYPSSGQTRPKLFGRLRRSADEYEKEGRLFYKLAGEHKEAAILEEAEVLYRFHEKFNLAKKPLNYISEHFIHLRNDGMFPFMATI